jgi:hypothetical protein
MEGINKPLQEAININNLLSHMATNSLLLSSMLDITLRRRHSMAADQGWRP